MTRSAIGFGNWIYTALFSATPQRLHRQAQDFFRVSIRTSESKDHDHKGRKPGEYVAFLVDLFTTEGAIVCDRFLGFGTTLLVSERTGRTCIGGELNPTYCASIIARWEAMSGEKAVRI